MKRPAADENEGRNVKRVKTNNEPDDTNFLVHRCRCPLELVNTVGQGNKMPKPPGHLRGIVSRIFPDIDKGKAFHFKVPAKSRKNDFYMFEVVLNNATSSWDALKSLHLKNNEEVLLSLKGASLVVVPNAKPDRPPRRLVYNSHFHIRYRDQELNTWNLKTVLPAPGSSAMPAALVNTTEQGPSELSKKKRRELQKLQRQANADENKNPTPLPADGEKVTVKEEVMSQRLPPTQAPLVEDARPKNPAPNEGEGKATEGEAASVPPKGGASSLSARGYLDLSTASQKSPGTYVNIIGVVISSSDPRQCQKGDKDWMQLIQLVDQSNVDESDILLMRGFKVNVFSKEKTSLPNPQRGDVIVFQRIKIDPNSKPAVGYVNRYSWALYSQGGNGFHHGPSSTSHPGQVLLQGGYSYAYTPFFQPPESDLQIARILQEWYTGVQALQETELEKSRVSHPDISVQYGRIQRIHRLIKDARPDIKPDGYFDCTVEVLKVFKNENDIYSVYVTDYTRNDDLPTISSSNIPQRLSQYVLKIEMWDEAAKIADGLQEGCYCSLKNARMMESAGGQLEGKLVEPKIDVLDPKTSDDRHLKALLERKAKDEADNGEVESEYPDLLIRDAVVGSFFNCTVQVLHIRTNENGKAVDAYVTDYTRRDDFSPISHSEAWAKGLEGMVLSIALQDGQARVAASFKPGTYCRIKNLRLRRRHDGAKGQLGGNRVLLEPINPTNPILEDLLDRKRGRKTPPPVKESPRLPNSRLKDIQTNKAFPEKYRVYGKVVDYKPNKLLDAISLICPHCGQKPSRLMARCIDCVQEDRDGSLTPVSNLVLDVEDEDLCRALVTVPLQSLVFEGLDFSKLAENRFQEQLEKRLRPLLPPQRGEEGPLLPMILVAWEDDSEHLNFALESCSPVP